ncbi:MAG: fibronectin type III domain-containing protein, partial [Candidatus Sumerlaeaceae bacterium]|nr:fibronectin type III domain-containing protein [Candidatus Sumerlaeaceae bacterium]
MMRLRPRSTAALALAFALMAQQGAAQVTAFARDQMFEIANEHLLLRWYCAPSNIYTGVANATCPYTTTGWKDGMAYKWGGYDTRDSYWLNVVINGGWAGDTNSAAIVNGTYGNDCSGYISRVWRSGRYTTSSFPSIAPEVGYTVIAPGDIMNYAASHVRMFERYTATNMTMQYECTTGVSPGRVVRRVLATDPNYLARRYNKVVAWPSIVRATASGPTSALIEFLGHASTGFRVYQSTDQTNWTAVVNESSLGVQAQSATVTGLANGTTYFFRVVAVNGTAESAPSAIFPLRIAALASIQDWDFVCWHYFQAPEDVGTADRPFDKRMDITTG